jgi:hypothetical protein
VLLLAAVHPCITHDEPVTRPCHLSHGAVLPGRLMPTPKPCIGGDRGCIGGRGTDAPCTRSPPFPALMELPPVALAGQRRRRSAASPVPAGMGEMWVASANIMGQPVRLLEQRAAGDRTTAAARQHAATVDGGHPGPGGQGQSRPCPRFSPRLATRGRTLAAAPREAGS